MDQIADSGLWAWILSHKTVVVVGLVLVLFGAGYIMGAF